MVLVNATYISKNTVCRNGATLPQNRNSLTDGFGKKISTSFIYYLIVEINTK